MSNRLSLDFNRYKPKQTYTFEVFFHRPDEQTEEQDSDMVRLTTAVSNLNIVKVPIQQEELMGYGLCWEIIPLHDVDSKEMKITFEETDDMLVSNTFGSAVCYSNSYKDVWSNCDFIIVVKYYNEYKYDDSTNQSAEKIERYRAIVRDIEHPKYNRSGNVDKLDVTVNFKVMLDDSIVQQGDKQVTIPGDFTNYMNNIYKRLKTLKQLFKGGGASPTVAPVEPRSPIPVREPTANKSEPLPAAPAPATNGQPEPARNTPAPTPPVDTSDNKPNKGSGRSKKSFPKLKRLTNNKNYLNKKAAGDNNYFNDASSYYKTIYKEYIAWLEANGKEQNLKTSREFLLGAGVLGKNYDDTTNHMCAAGTNIQASLAANIQTYTSYGNGADFAGNYAKAKGYETMTFEFNEKTWANAQAKIKELCASGEYVVSLEYNDGKYGHAFTVVDGVSMSDYQHKGTAGLGVSNTAHGGAKSITITKIA